MKRSVKTILITLLVLCLTLLVLTACNNNNEQNKKPTTPQKLQLTNVTATVTQEGNDDMLSVSWSKANGATKYVVSIGFGDSLNTFDKTANELSYTQVLTQNGKYTVKVKAIGDGTNYTDSDEVTKTVQYVKQITPPTTTEPVKLPTPQNLKYDNDTKLITWDEVEHAKEYEIKLNTSTYITEKCSFNMINREDGEYTFSVKAIGDRENYLDSDVTATITFTKERPPIEKIELNPVFGVTISNTGVAYQKKITWDPVNGADKYELTFDLDTENVIIIEADKTEYLYDGELGRHTLDIRAIADDDNERYYSSTEYTTEYFKINAPQEEPLTYQAVLEKLDNNIKSTMIQKLGGEEGFIYKGVQTIDADVETAYVTFELDGYNFITPIELNGVSQLDSVEDLNTYIDNVDLDNLITSQTRIMSDDMVQQLVSRAIEKNQLASSVSLDDIKWCMANPMNSNRTTIIILTYKNEKITYNLYIQGTVNDYLAGTAGYNISREKTTSYKELSEQFENN